MTLLYLSPSRPSQTREPFQTSHVSHPTHPSRHQVLWILPSQQYVNLSLSLIPTVTALVQIPIGTCLHDSEALHCSPCSQFRPLLATIHVALRWLWSISLIMSYPQPKAPWWLSRISNFLHYLVFAYPSGFSLILAIPYTSTSSFFCSTYSSLRVSSRECLPSPSWFTFNASSLWTTPWCGMPSRTTALTSPYCDSWLPLLSLTTQGSFLDRGQVVASDFPALGAWPVVDTR